MKFADGTDIAAHSVMLAMGVSYRRWRRRVSTS